MIMSTLFLHHLDEDDAIAFLREAAAKTRDRLLIQDILRSRLSYWFARPARGSSSSTTSAGSMAARSVEGAFTREEARELAKMAGLADAEIVPRFPFRYLIRWVRPG